LVFLKAAQLDKKEAVKKVGYSDVSKVVRMAGTMVECLAVLKVPRQVEAWVGCWVAQ